ncbi:MAG TPA: histidine kinase dimerization/phospho-acceptor domain-containing protein, partial [Fibrobacteria bacterium]|nr:histidine kinase dimerization/phospho-acceptor domain-containing protein [Fibrobacteria bacterium]
MNFSRHIYLVFLLSILAPGLILAYLSFRTAKDERILIEKSLETRNEEFVDAVQGLLEKTKSAHLSRLQEQLRRFSSSSSPDNYLFLATDLLDNPLIQSLAVFREDEMVFPRRLQWLDTSDVPAAEVDSPDLPEGARHAVELIQQEYLAGRHLQALRLIRSFAHASDSLFATRAGAPYRHGLWLLEIKCLVRMGLTEEAVARGRELIQSLLRGDGFASYHQVKFHLSETVNLLTSMENLPREIRDWFWSVHQRAEIFLVNAEFVSREWAVSPEQLIRTTALDFQNPIRIDYLEGHPYLVIGYPWLDKETRIIARLNESVFTEAVRGEIILAKKSAWKDMEFALVNQRDQVVMSTDSLSDRKVAVERDLSADFPAWRLLILKKKEGELIALGRRKLLLLYTMLAFSLAALLLGALFVFMGLKNERKMVRMKSNFLSAVSHELKTPLTSIRMFAELLESGRQTQEEKRKRYAHLIGEEAMRLHGMIEGILNFTRLEEKRARVSMT